ncbi:uncharacterized protein PFL1_01386 [Pseudozyma flocculosa PF-1]|uniref:Uncharacterized protein n=1 Tax=Pseudozyma flocculosa TaxID=84751 RepID=A0A5C3EXH5_9BASI|nr:uncharacterized protein PFL1_01386 [Pseudozyma flocculosa PF-1]EPQ31198.1 hypothetical protein PFL1_01386 [Pseudozyma flocculosa PF-1]SPO36306.1 uncharacterized protein PSFLO_01777 [Pseudozyma flocculosa]
MQSTASAIAAAAISGTDLGARANSAKGSDTAAAATTASNSGSSGGATFDGAEAERWLSARWKVVESSISDPTLTSADRAEVHKSAPGTGGGAWGANKRTTNAQFAADLAKAAAAAGIR